MNVRGKAFVFGDRIDTDVLAPGPYMREPMSVLASHCLEAVDPAFASEVRPGDIVGCDDDGVLLVPQEVSEEVVGHAVAILLADMKGRRRLYERLGMPMDETVDVERVESYYQQL